MLSVRDRCERAGGRVRTLSDPLRRRLLEGRIPSWLIGALLVLITWRTMFIPPSPGLDPSWETGLSMAVKEGLQFGPDVVFTYGPLGFLRSPWVAYQDLAVIAFCWSLALYVAFATSLVWALRRSLSTGAAAVAAYLVLALLPGVEQPVALAAILGLGMLGRGDPPLGMNAFLVGGASLAAIETLAKISIGPLVLAIALIALVGARARWWQLAGLVGLYVGEVLLLWVISGQSLSNLADFVGNSARIVAGYNDAMASRESSSAASLLEVLAPLAVIVASLGGRYRDRLAQWAGFALVGLSAFLLFKQGVVRFGPNHMAIWISTACLLWIAIPWDATRRAALISGAAVLGALAVHVVPPVGTGVDVIGHVKFARDQLKTLLVPSRRSDLEDGARASMQDVYGLDEQTLALLHGHTVSIDPSEIGVAWAYDLDWSPLPVFQNYSAYTRHLDQLNAAAIEDPAGPERILRQLPTSSIDGRFPGWDPPAQAIATLCHFEPLRSTASWQVLARTANRCGQERPIRSVESSFDERVPVPAPGPGEVVFARVEGVGIDGLERLRAFFWRPRSRYAIVNGQARYRIVPGTAEDGLMLRAGRGVAGPGPASQVPQARTIMLTGAGGDLRFEFFGLRVRPARGQAASSRAIASRASSGSSTTRSPAPRRISRTR